MIDDRVARLKVAAMEAADCTKCPLHAGRKNSVFSRGNPYAEILFVGDAPGIAEDEEGKSFVGPGGQLLDKLIKAMGLIDGDYYLTDAVKCLSEEFPEEEETDACGIFLYIQLMLVAPKVIVALGENAAQALGLDATRGEWQEIVVEGVPYSVMVTHSPNYLIKHRGDTPGIIEETGKDLFKVLKFLGREPPKKAKKE